MVLSLFCRFLLNSIVFPCVLSVSSFTATWWSLSNFWFSCVHVWILLFSVCCLHSNLLSILLTSAQFFAFFLWFCDRLMCFCHELFLVWRCLVFYVYLLIMVMWGFIFAKSSHQQRKHRSSQSIWKWVYLHTPLWKWKRLIPARSKASLKTCNCKSPCFDKTPNALGPSTKPLWQP